MARLSIVLPTYNEADNVAAMVPALQQEFQGADLEIIVVDDDSPDGTAKVAGDAGATVYVRQNERGLASAVIHGIENATGDWVLVMDCDFQHPLEAAQRMWKRAQQGDVDVVMGSRFVSGGDDKSFSLARRIISRGARLMAQIAVRPVSQHGVTDPMSGFFAVRKSILSGVRLRPIGYKIGLEIIARAPIRNIADVGYQFAARETGQSKLGATVILQYILHTIRLGFSRAGYLWVYLAVIVAVATIVLLGSLL